MWEPRPGWQRLPGAGPSTLGVWAARVGDRDVVVKRLVAPSPHDPPETGLRTHPAYWRRAADVALSGVVSGTPGLREPELLEVEEDAAGVTLVHARVEDAASSGLFLASRLGRFAGADLGTPPWLAVDQLAARLAQVERRGGWRTLARTPMADLADHLWHRRRALLEQVARLPQVPQHGDPVPSNLLGHEEDEVVAVDWSTLGRGPVGSDLGYLSLSTREAFQPLVVAYCSGLPDGLASRAQVELGARVSSIYTVLTRADWALARAAQGEGALAGKYRHPSVAPFLRAMQRQLPQVEALLDPRQHD
ncbi:phosphotransferase family protein [Nocardioides campestrisoli]|uniref:phosphotransferase family protein n=1 Tax=Nocardioides campestrisoli TaxID=2736757 RepID=UPI00163D4B9E|nr:phosphotransferase [Nocardioides campestrisoli]